MPQSLYQKYRPQTWGELTDQNQIKITLEHEIVRGQVAHAYLFVGPRGVGKTTAARLLAKAVNCTERKPDSAEPCNSCASCQNIQEGRSFDILEIDAASHTGVDHVREHILNAAEVSAGHHQYRVFIIDEVHMLSTAAFNAMLKVLEEPPAHVIFILATTEVPKVPATIISRCQRFDFKKIPVDAMCDRLRLITKHEGVQVDDDVLEAIAEHADGSLRDAESTLGQVVALGVKHITFDEASLIIPRSNMIAAAELVDYLVARDTGQALVFANRLVEEGVSVSVFMADVIVWLRNMLLAKVGDRLDLFSRLTVGELQERLVKVSARMSLSEIQRCLDIFMSRRRMASDAPLPQLPIELAIVEASVALAGDTGTSSAANA